MTTDFLAELGTTPETESLKDNEKNRDLALLSLSTRHDAATFYNAMKRQPGGGANDVSLYMRKKAIDAEVQQIMQADAPVEDRIAKLQAVDYDAPEATDEEIEAGVVNNARPDLVVSFSDIKKQKSENLKVFVDELNAIREENYLRQGQERSGLRLAGEIAENLVIGTGSHEVFHAIQEFLPGLEANRITGYSDAVVEFRKYLEDLPEEEAMRVAKEFALNLRKRSGTVIDNDFTFHQNVEMLLANLNGASTVGEAINGLVVVAEAAGVGLPLASGISKGVKIAAGSLAKYLGVGEDGARSLVRAANAEAGADVVSQTGTTPGAVFAEHVMPKPAGAGFDPGRHAVDLDLLDPDKVEALKNSVVEDLKQGVSTVRLNDTVIENTDDGFKATVRVGTKEGKPYKSQGIAERWAKKIDGAKAVQVGDDWYIELQEAVQYTSKQMPDVAEEAVQGNHGMWRTLFGRNVMFKGKINELATQATLQSVKEEALLRKIVEPYSKLKRAAQTDVNLALTEGESAGKWWTNDELIQRWGDGPKAAQKIAAYRSVHAVADRVHQVRNVKLRNQMVERGYRSFVVGGQQRIVQPIENLQGATKVLDINGVPVPTPRKGYRFVRLVGEEANKRTKILNDIVAIPENMALDDLPLAVLKKVDGYLPRQYSKPYFVVRHQDEIVNGVKRSRFVDDKLPEGKRALRQGSAIKTAPSQADAEDFVATLNAAAGEGVTYSVRAADEITGAIDDSDDISQAIRDGLLAGQKRNPEALADVIPGLVQPPRVAERVGRMIQAGGTAAGIGRYADMIQSQLKSAYGDLGFTGIGKLPDPPSNVAQQVRWKEGAQLVRHLRNLNGLGVGQLNAVFRTVRNSFANVIYNNASHGRLGAPARAIADELSGLNSGVTDFTKQATFASYLLLNPARQAVLQATMVPTYAGTVGGFKYITLGGFATDSLKWATGTATGDLKKTIEAFDRSGLKELVDGHLFDLGRAAEAGIKSPRLNGLLSKPLNASKRFGMDLGVGADKRGAFLFATNRFKTMNKRMPANEAEWKEIASFAESMALNQNRSDSLFTQHGALSLITQFLSHQFKMTGRILGAEQQWTRGERLRMAAAGLMSYGAAGYGLTEVYDQIKASLGLNVPTEYDVAIREGLVGAGVNLLLNVADLDDPEQFAFSSGFSPMNFFGDYVRATELFGESIISGDFSFEVNPAFAAASLVGDAAGALHFTAKAFGVKWNSDLPPEAFVRSIVPEYAKLFPVTNNVMKAYYAARLGEIQSANGKVLAEDVGYSAAVANLFGLRTKSEIDLRTAQNKYYGEYAESTSESLYEEVSRHAEKNAPVLLRYFELAEEGSLTQGEFERIMEVHWDTNRKLMDEAAFGRYMRTINQEFLKYRNSQGLTVPKMITNLYHKAFAQGRVMREENLIEWIRQQRFDGAQKLADDLQDRLIGTEQ